MLIINSVEKARLSADSFSYSGSGVAWKARVVLFLGFAALAGGMAGGVTVFVLRFVVPGVPFPALTMGVENVVANALVGLRYVLFIYFRGRGCCCAPSPFSIMRWELGCPALCGRTCANMFLNSSSVVLWVSQNMEDEYSYNLAL